MVVLNMNKETCDGNSSNEHISLREERRRTGRYVAAGTAIFLSLLGVYQALIQGTPEYAALFAPAVIMFIYVLWILYASRNQNARLLRMNEIRMRKRDEEPTPLLMMEALEKVDNEKQLNVACTILMEEKDPLVEEIPVEKAEKNDNRKQFSRSYSIA
ncbi:hypothetical protein ILUMI_22529 [Ignelater luminosus]|uniref:Uncharacterized protein n=1 Tax=Ignelater luminosus TaxID=2038154 RepID=A0A8K0CGJ1_IGNLU|nr:hypothetical protein ILUMI_22529 [Ignelater luminosus]